jgi:hypothetical protein
MSILRKAHRKTAESRFKFNERIYETGKRRVCHEFEINLSDRRLELVNTKHLKENK